MKEDFNRLNEEQQNVVLEVVRLLLEKNKD